MHGALGLVTLQVSLVGHPCRTISTGSVKPLPMARNKPCNLVHVSLHILLFVCRRVYVTGAERDTLANLMLKTVCSSWEELFRGFFLRMVFCRRFHISTGIISIYSVDRDIANISVAA
jgi:hypothetical protein